MTSLFGKTAIVTGAANGLGRIIAQRLARDGAYVVLAHDDDNPAADAAMRSISAEGGWAISVNADLRHPEAIAKLFAHTEQRLGAGIDIAVAASESFLFRPLVDMSDEDFEHVLGDNLFGTFYVMREAARRVNDGGRIIAVSHDPDHAPTGTAAFAAAKGGIDQMVRVLAREVGWRGITVNGLAARQEDRTAARCAPTSGLSGIELCQHPFFVERRRFPRDLAGIASLLASDDGQPITGQVLGVSADLPGLIAASGLPAAPLMKESRTVKPVAPTLQGQILSSHPYPEQA